MPGPLYNADNVVVGHAILFLCPWVRGAVTAPVADTVALFDPNGWPTPWVGVGATNEGFSVAVDASTTPINIEEQSTPVDETVEAKSVQIMAALVEDTLTTIRLAWGGSVVSATVSKASMTLIDGVTKYTVGMEMRNAVGLARRIYIPKMSTAGGGEVSFRRAADKRTYPMTLTSLCKPTEILITDMLA